MKHTAILPVLMLSLALAGCATHGTMQLSDEARPLAADATFQNEEVKDASGFDWGTEKDRVDIVASLKAAIDWELAQANLAGTGYVLRTDIVRYEPGNAFKRWLMPGFGATRLNVVGKVFTREGALVATVPVERYIGFGGGFTIGAWKDVFQDVAKEIVRVLKKGCAKPGASAPKEQERAPAGEGAW
ncbi:MAG: DUF4410 domain-containing protein [Desulfovibrio sp.]|nr:DUF4410 domain-containing protein [Desulfovibrio sp.]